MEEKANPLSGVQVKLRRSPLALKILVAVLIVFTLAAAVALSWVQSNIRQATDQMRQEAAALEHENSVLEEKTGDLGSVQSVEQIAEEELDLADPNTILIETTNR